MKWRSQAVPWGVEGEVVGVVAASAEDRPRFFVATRDGRLIGVDLDDGARFFEATLPFTFEPDESGFGAVELATLSASPDGRFVAVVQTRGLQGALFDVAEAKLLRPLERDDYHANVSGWTVALLRRDGRDVLVTATAWNRLEAFALPSFERLAPDSDASEHDYFLGLASPSPSGRWLATFGWHWHPIGALRVFDVDAWLGTKSDPPPFDDDHRFWADWWDGPMCWLDDERFVTAGEAAPEDAFHQQQDGLVVIARATGEVLRFLPGLASRRLASDGERLLCLGETTQVVSLDTFEVEARLEARLAAWHDGARVGLELVDGTTARLHWLSGAHAEARPAHGLPVSAGAAELAVLGDALEEAGAPPHLIAHCRDGRPHGRRCWVLEGLR